MSVALTSRVASSATFSLVGTHLHCDGSDDSRISPSLCATNCLYLLASLLIQWSTVFESVQNTVLLILNCKIFVMALAALIPKTAACSSNRGIDNGFNGLTFVFDQTMFTKISSPRLTRK